ALLTQPCILEARQKFRTEVSMMVTRSAAGVVTTFPLVENQHQHHILHTTIAPANVQPSVHSAARKIAVSIAESLELRG
ncbi:ATP-grasp domain-containing protein, partial [Streptococcus thermophilus]|nr:ATP-grasp domain-containing protein [Streptococcus thermophilus]